MRLFQRSFARTFPETLLLFSLTIALGLIDLLSGPLPSLAQDLSPSSSIVSWEYDQVNPAIAFNAAGNKYLTVWEDHHWGWGTDWDIYGRLVGTDGLPAGEQFGISWEGSNSRLRPRVAANQQNGEFLVVWEYAFTDTDHDIYARRVSGTGDPDRQ